MAPGVKCFETRNLPDITFKFEVVPHSKQLNSIQMAFTFHFVPHSRVGRDSVVGVTTRHLQDGPGITIRWGERFFAQV